MFWNKIGAVIHAKVRCPFALLSYEMLFIIVACQSERCRPAACGMSDRADDSSSYSLTRNEFKGQNTQEELCV